MIRDDGDKLELIGQIIDIFEDFLGDKGILIPNEDRFSAVCAAYYVAGQDDFISAPNIFGKDYDGLSEKIEATLRSWGLL